jgi:hypothetical protein
MDFRLVKGQNGGGAKDDQKDAQGLKVTAYEEMVSSEKGPAYPKAEEGNPIGAHAHQGEQHPGDVCSELACPVGWRPLSSGGAENGQVCGMVGYKAYQYKECERQNG